MDKEFINSKKGKVIIVGVVLVIAIVFVVLYFNQNFVDEKYCNGVDINCQYDAERGCVNTLQKNVIGTYCNPECYCNTEKNVCEQGKNFCYEELQHNV
ncbi:MAG: hypothetical protein ABIJ74_00205 [archaeon]